MKAGIQARTDCRAADSILRALDFVEENLQRGIGVQEMAGAAYYSIFHFSRLFALATGHAPYDYLMRRRVARAAEEVVSTDRSLTEIGLDMGFEVPDSFTRAFRRCFGMTPSEARAGGSYPRSLARTRIRRDYVEEMLACPPERPEVREDDGFVLVGTWERPVFPDAFPPPENQNAFALVERDEGLRPAGVFRGSISDPAVVSAPAWPLMAARVPAGPRARFPVRGDSRRLELITQFAYRSWLPFRGFSRAPGYDILEIGSSGIAALELPLD